MTFSFNTDRRGQLFIERQPRATKLEKDNARKQDSLRTNQTLDYASTHREIVERCQGGNREAQFELYSLYSKAMYNVCLRMLKKERDAEDLLQNSFVDVFSKLHTFRYESSVGAWIKRIVVNNCINHLKKRRLELVNLDDRFQALPSEEPIERELPCSVEAVQQAMQLLPDGYRIVFSLYLIEGYDHKEISEILHISEATSKSQYSRAKAKLRSILADLPIGYDR